MKKKSISKVNIDLPKLRLSTCSEKKKRYLLMYIQISTDQTHKILYNYVYYYYLSSSK